MRRFLLRSIFHTAVALWLGMVMPLLCVPGVTSDHQHGLHLAMHLAAPAKDAATRADYGHSHTHGTHDQSADHQIKTRGPLDRFGHMPGLPTSRPELDGLGVFGLLPMFLSLLIPALWGRAGGEFRLNPALPIPPRPWRPPRAA